MSAPFWILMAKEMRDARRHRWFIVIAALFALMSVSLSLLGLSGLQSVGIAGFGRTAASLLNLVLLVVPLMGLLLGSMSLVAEKERGTLTILLSQPLDSAEIFAGKFFGSAVMLVAAVALGFGASGFVIARYAGLDQIQDYLLLVCFTVLLGLAFLSLGFLVSVMTARHSTAVGTSIFLWFLFLYLSDLGLMGTAIVLKMSAHAIFWLALLNPAQVFKLAVIGGLQKNLEAFGAAGLYAWEIFGSWMAVLFGVILTAWAALPLVAAFLLFKRRCMD